MQSASPTGRAAKPGQRRLQRRLSRRVRLNCGSCLSIKGELLTMQNAIKGIFSSLVVAIPLCSSQLVNAKSGSGFAMLPQRETQVRVGFATTASLGHRQSKLRLISSQAIPSSRKSTLPKTAGFSDFVPRPTVQRQLCRGWLRKENRIVDDSVR